MSNHKYVALDVHQSSIVLLVVDQAGKQLQQSILEARADRAERAKAGSEEFVCVTTRQSIRCVSGPGGERRTEPNNMPPRAIGVSRRPRVSDRTVVEEVERS